ncbi:MetQ/NlpA family ABC transporter substrate-binding protein [Bifidobacterium sp. ESL0775]|uniref:MetQ/NlpA family ABC transporter substrate-binding protein n=1 Tax=Bifidobacterium sp. ESL0775 TaxID=2983230 RepID=UPI0023F6E0EC|nr:MetQ/NlpA family ABC transporter substrate-binding protein [Bifidobacterium sp. ESL0775]WEV69928.1 MetQ/NlpA family ABC transporter substrate-binding protein [Bifidobacterium sp. ESL0775]
MATKKQTKAKHQLFALLAAIVVVVLVIAGISIFRNAKANKEQVVTVALVGNSDDAEWKAVQARLDEEHANIKLKYRTFQDAIYADQALANHELDISACEHYAFLNQDKKEKGYKLTPIAETYISPMNLYSQKYKSVKDFKPGDKVAVPNNVTNLGRSLKVLDSAGLIKLKDNTKADPTTDDIVANPSGIVVELNDAASIINLLPDYAGGVVNTNFIVDAGKKPEDAIYAPKLKPGDPSFKPYVNIIIANTSNKDSENLRKIVDAYHTRAVAEQLIKDHNIPMFKY